jgi:hypothetical protein
MVTQKKMSLKSLEETLKNVDKVSRMKNGQFKIYQGFFYTHGKSAEDFATDVMRQLDGQGAILVDYGMVWKEFKGGAPVARQSHWWVIIKFEE